MASMGDFSIGREQAPAEICAMAWSPAGLADGGRCALAILTSNSLLSIWGPMLDTSDSENWQRRWVANSGEVDGEVKDWQVVAMAWAPALETLRLQSGVTQPVHPSTAPFYQSHYLALITDDGETIIYHVSYDFESPDFVHRRRLCASYASPVLSRGENGGVPRNKLPIEELRRFYNAPRTSALHSIDWSEWQYDAEHGTATATLLRSFHGQCKTLRVVCDFKGGIGGEISTSDSFNGIIGNRIEDTEMDWTPTDTTKRREASKGTRNRLQQLRTRLKTWNQPYGEHGIPFPSISPNR